jgi:polyphosphate kinase 2 (PPK2 family)
MEEQLHDGDTAVVKLWLHIGEDEQMKRFKEREKTKWKQFKIGEEDWRNRKRWHDYVVAAHDMVGKTGTKHAPWHLVAANDKRHARLEVLRRVLERLDA